ncbi:MAG: UPF0175 family protein [Candidatus Hydrothermarchaeota archaeon]
MELEKEIDSLLRTEIYKNKDELIRDAIRALLEMKPNLRIEIGVDLYKRDEVTLWRAAEIAGVNLEEFKEILASRGIKIKVLGTKEETEKRLRTVFGA